MEQTTLAVERVPVQNFCGCPGAAGSDGRPDTTKIVLPYEGAGYVELRSWEKVSSLMRVSILARNFFRVENFSSRIKKVSTRNASAEELSVALRVNARLLVQ